MFRQNFVAKYAYVYMAKPICSNVPPFCLACLGTDSKFSAENIMARGGGAYIRRMHEA